jgi:predicted nuclease of restriction endonuclease-like (RecB) superfamily
MQSNYIQSVRELKTAILKSRYNAAKMVNKEMLLLYYFVGKYVSQHSRNKNWGKGAIEHISSLLQQELTGLSGFSATNLKNMRTFFEEWSGLESQFLHQTTEILFDFMLPENRQTLSDELPADFRQMTSDELNELFFNIGFSHHVAIIQQIKEVKNRIFYIYQSARNFWTHTTLKYHLKERLHLKLGGSQNNFIKTISDINFKEKAQLVFKDELLLDFVNIQDSDEEPDERVLEQEIVQNIKKFIMALGADFTFIGNQYRLLIEDEEFFIDLLFFNRKLQSLVAIELKKGKFKAEYAGKMNLYLSALDEYIKQPHENPSIGIILCKEKNSKIVEFAFRDTSKPMGVITYKTYKELPEYYKSVLPSVDDLKKLL